MAKELLKRKKLKRLKDIKKGFYSFFVCTLALLQVGCTHKQIFLEKTDPNAVTYTTQDNMAMDTIYAKEGSYFYDLYSPLSTASGVTSAVSSSRLIFYSTLESFPKIYNDGYLAVASNGVPSEAMILERYEDLGYSIGLYGGYVDQEGYLCFSIDNMVEGSNIYLALSGNVTSDYIRISQINDIDVSSDNLTAGGIITGFEYGGKYKLTYYTGTYKRTVNVYADTGIMRSYELFVTEDPILTDNTFTKWEFPSDLKSGYYYCSGIGFIAYYDSTKGSIDTAKVDMNEAYYQTEEEQFEAFSKKYTISIPEIKNNIRIEVAYELGDYTVDDIKCILSDPAGTTYDMTATEDLAYVEISQMMAGSWTVNILPKDLNIISVTPIATTPENDTVNDVEEFVFEEADSNIQFVCTYTGEGEIWGTVEQVSTKEVKELVLDASNQKLVVTYPYLAADTYKVTIYHYVDTAVEEITYQTDESTQEVDLVIIE